MMKKNSNVRSRFAQRLRAIRTPRGFKTARSFAEVLGIDENRYTRYERAEVEPDLQLMMKICDLLDATPNDLLCDTNSARPIEAEMPSGFTDQEVGRYSASEKSPAHGSLQQSNDSLSHARQAATWQLADIVAKLEATNEGKNFDNLSQLDKLRRIGPIHARIQADPFAFLRQLPDRLQGLTVSEAMEAQIGALLQDLVAASRPGDNDHT